MQDNRNSRCGLGCDNMGTVCISTNRVLDCCRDRDCFEDVRIFLTSFGEEVVANASNIRTRCAKLIGAYVGVDAVPFNRGFYRVTVRYYVKVECEACLCMGKSQSFCGIAVLEKDVILYGGEGSVVSYSSSPATEYCGVVNTNNSCTNDPIAVVETVEPIVLSTKVMDCSCSCNSCCSECCEIPESICGCIDGELVSNSNSNSPHLYISFGIFSVIRIEREAQLLVQATDYSVPDKECTSASSDDNPCSLFNTMPFPINRFKTTVSACVEQNQSGGSCGCGNK
ncbi:MAG: hypothetical protein E7612_06420 [Ruminococcaceae bacterium]|nr:hypothetical protein [Oscillospiraceae bacterium]